MHATATDTFITSRSPQELISQRATEIWESRGRPQGQDLAIWIDAEKDLIRRRLIRADGQNPVSGPAFTRREAGSIDADKVQERLSEFGAAPSRSATSLD